MANKIKIDLGKMTLGEQDAWESVAGCRFHEVLKLGLTGKRLAATLFIFAKRENPDVKFEDFLNMGFDAASEMMADDDDPKD